MAAIPEYSMQSFGCACAAAIRKMPGTVQKPQSLAALSASQHGRSADAIEKMIAAV
jgi:hypothetical protein